MSRRCSSSGTSSLLFLILLFLQLGSGSWAQLTISATTPSSSGSASAPNTFIGAVGTQIAASLLATSTPVLLWGAVPSADIITTCQQIVNTGSLTVTASVSNDWGGSEDLTLQVQATGGCLAASDASGTEFVFTDNYGRKSAIVCPSNAGSTGCGVYLTGDDVNSIYNSYTGGGSKRKLLGAAAGSSSTSRRLLADNCQSGAAEGAITGAVTGVLGTAECLALGPLAPFCIIGVLGVSAELGALGGCVASCFPGDATVQTIHGTFKPMSQLEVGDQIAVWQHERLGGINNIAYQDVYAFGHKDANATSLFLEIVVEALDAPSTSAGAPSTTLRLTRMHFIPTAATSAATDNILYKRAQDVEVGDIVWATLQDLHEATGAVPCIVKEISITSTHGLYNPLTMSGTIIVDGVVASVHSEWFLDPMFDSMGLTHLLPSTYQLLLTPVRMLYSIMGKQAYIATYKWLDEYLDIATFGTKYGGTSMAVLCATTTSSLLATLLILINAQRRNNSHIHI